MKTWVHLLASSILALLLYPIFSWEVLLILIGGVLIDIDHYLWFLIKYKKTSMLECYRYFMKDVGKNDYKDINGTLFIFHTIEFLLIMALFSFYIEFALAFTIGLLSHFFLDLIWLYLVPKRLVVNHSFVSWISSAIQKF